MRHAAFIRLALAAGLGLSALAAAADPAMAGEHLPPPPGLAGADLPDHPGAEGHGESGFGGPGPGGPGFMHGPIGGPIGPLGGGPAGEVLQTLHEIEHLYREQGKTREILALYQDVLGKTRDPLLRHAAYAAIARAQAQPAELDRSVATLKQSLDESLARLNALAAPGPHEGRPAP